MSAEARRQDASPGAIEAGASPGRFRAAALCANELGRALLGHAASAPSTAGGERAGDALAAGLPSLFPDDSALELRITGSQVLLGSEPLLLEQAAKDALIGRCTRDGVGALRLLPGLDPLELGRLLRILACAGEGPQHHLARLVRDADLPHVSIETDAPEAAGESSDVPPRASSGAAQESVTSADRIAAVASVLADRSPAAIDGAGGRAGEELRAAFSAERDRSLVGTALATARCCLPLCETEQERADLRQHLRRVVRFALASSAWTEGGEVLALFRQFGGTPEELRALSHDLLESEVTAALWASFDRQPPEQAAAFIEFVRGFGDATADWLVLAMAESNERWNRRLFAQALGEICRDDPERLLPWLADPRWFVVRNVVYVLGLIGGDSIVPQLQRVVRHPEPRVRKQCLVALGRASPAAAQPLLLLLLSQPDPETFRGAVEMLSSRRDPIVAGRLLACLSDPRFQRRSSEERIALYRALGRAGDERILPSLEEALLGGTAGGPGAAAEAQALAFAVAEIGGAGARSLLERGARSSSGDVRNACAAGLSRVPGDG